MTSANSFTDIKKAKFMPFFGISLKQRLTTMLLITIIFFFVLPIPLMMFISQGTFIEEAGRLNHLREVAREWSYGIRFVLVPLTSLLSIVMSCAMLRYLKNRVAVDFYHSLPIKRSRLYINQLLVGYIVLIVPLIIMLIVSLIVCACNNILSGIVITNIIGGFIDCIAYSLVFYGISTIVGMVSGVTGVHLVLTFVTIFIIPLIYFSVIYFVGIFNENMWISWYFSNNVLRVLSPSIRFFVDSSSLRIWEIAVYLVVAAGMFIGGYFIYAYRKSERSGMSVVFKPLGTIIKYVLVFVMTLLGGLLFYIIMESFFWTVFGMICGGLLTFMLANTILQKSAKAMFKGLKGFIIYCAAIAVSMLVLLNNVFGINSSVPEVKNLSKVIFDSTSYINEFEFRDEKVMEALRQMYVDGDWSGRDYLYEGTDGFYVPNAAGRNSMVLNVVFVPKFGVPQAKTVRIYNLDNMIDQLRCILDSEEFKSQYIGMIDDSQLFDVELNDVLNDSYYNDRRLVLSNYYGDDKTHDYTLQIKAALKEDSKDLGFDYFQNPILGYARLYPNKYTWRNTLMPITLHSDNIYKLLLEVNNVDANIDDKFEGLLQTIDEVIVVDIATGESHSFTKPDDLRIIFSNLASFDGYAYEYFPMTLVDTKYVVEYKTYTSSSYQDTVSYDGYDERADYSESHSSYFLYDKVPEVVSRIFDGK